MQTYEHGGIRAIELVDDNGEPRFMLSVNLPESSHLPSGRSNLPPR